MRDISKSELIFLVEEGKSSYEIAKIFNRGQTSVRYWLKIYDLKSRGKPSGMTSERSKIINSKRGRQILEKMDWSSIQKDYDNNMPRRKLVKKYKTSEGMLVKAAKLGKLKLRTKEEANALKSRQSFGRKHSPETKMILRQKRKKYLDSTNKHSWKTHDKFKSQPCEWLKTELKKRNYIFEEELQPLLHKKRFFSMDIAFPEVKFAIEINGRQHYDENGNLAPYYQNRHDLIKEDGWEIWEVPYHTVKTVGFLDLVLSVLWQKEICPIVF